MPDRTSQPKTLWAGLSSVWYPGYSIPTTFCETKAEWLTASLRTLKDWLAGYSTTSKGEKKQKKNTLALLRQPLWETPKCHADTNTDLSFLVCGRGHSLDGGEADVELLDDGGVQTVEVQQQDELVIETWRNRFTISQIEKPRTQKQFQERWANSGTFRCTTTSLENTFLCQI